MTSFDSDNGSEFINHDVSDWLQARDIAQTRSRPYRKNDQATVESKNNHVVRKHAFYWRNDTPAELALLNQLWPLVSLRLNFFTPTRKPIDYTTAANGRRRRVYDTPKTPWQRVLDATILTDAQVTQARARVHGINPADLTRQINHVQTQLTDMARSKTETLAATKPLDLESLQPSINRLTPTKRKPHTLTTREAPPTPTSSLPREAPRVPRPKIVSRCPPWPRGFWRKATPHTRT